jgi:hypothetical protein
MNGRLTSICVFCGSSDGVAAEYLEAAERTGAAIARRGARVVYGGGGTGLMRAVADGALRSGGQVIGVLTEQLNTPALRHDGLTERRVVPTMHERKALMASLSDGFVALPGGIGTFEELFEILAWAQLGIHHRPIGLLDTRGYYSPLRAALAHARQEGFIYREHGALYVSEADPEALLDRMQAYRPPSGLERWLNREESEA